METERDVVLLIDSNCQSPFSRRLRYTMPPPSRQIKGLSRFYLHVYSFRPWGWMEGFNPWNIVCWFWISYGLNTGGGAVKGILRVEPFWASVLD
jgi:hypothetical protein